MKIHAFMAPAGLDIEIAARGEGSVIDVADPGLVRQWGSVLRLEVGERILLFYNDGLEAECEVCSRDRRLVSVRIISKRPNPASSALEKRPVRAYVALTKGDSFEIAVQKLAELGVRTLVPLAADRSIKRSANLERLSTIAYEASEQAMSASPMRIEPPMTVAAALADASARCAGGFVVAHVPALSQKGTADETTSTVELGQAWETAGAVGTRGFFVGPEGGFSDQEVDAVAGSNARFVSLGPTVLRAETAAIVRALSARDTNR